MTAAKFFTFSKSEEVNLIRVMPIGNIIAATVCSPMNEDKIAEIDKNPKTMLDVLFPVTLNIPKAIRESHPCRMITTASIRDPMIKNTASFINAFAMPSAESIPPYICANSI